MNVRLEDARLLDQRSALGAYFDALLDGSADAANPIPALVDLPAHAVGQLDAPPPLPEWARQPFSCLIGKVHGLALAFPLARLSGVVAWREPGTSARGEWLVGDIAHHGTAFRVVETASLILPESRRVARPARRRHGHIVLLDVGAWGLICDEVLERVTVQPQAVRWRTAPGRWTWLTGIVREEAGGLVDPDLLAAALEAKLQASGTESASPTA